MERKAFHALLLSLAVIAGAVTITTDAYAQTNTERLITVVDNTNEANSLLSDLLDAVTNGFAQVLELLGAVDSDLQAIHGDLEAIDGDLHAIDDDLQAIHGDLEALDGDIQSLANTVGGLGAAASAITSINQGITTNAASIAALNDKLDMIAETVGVVQETVETGPAPTTSNMLHSDDTEQTVAVADFAGSVTKHPNDGVYEASNTFSCTGDVFLDSMTITNVDPVLFTVTVLTTDNVAPVTTVSLNGVNLYETYDNSGAGAATDDNVLEITKDRDFDNQYLSAGSVLTVKGSTDQSADGNTADDLTSDANNGADRGAQNHLKYEVNATAIDAEGMNVYFTLAEYVGLTSNKATLNASQTANPAALGTNVATKTQLGTTELYTITVKWFAPSSDTTCSITSAVDAAPGLDASATRLVSLIIDEDDTEATGSLKPFEEATLNCNGEDTAITGISIEAGGFLTQYVELTLTAGGESATVLFDGNASDEDTSELPFRFSGSDLTISGEGINDLLLNISYDTVEKNTCR